MNSVFKSKLDEVLRIIIENQEKLNISSVYLFGSCARSEECATSDIDIMLVAKGQRKETSLVVEVLDLRDELSYPKVDVTVRTKEELMSKLYRFNEFFHKDKILLWEE